MAKIYFTDGSVLRDTGRAGFAAIPVDEDGNIDVENALTGAVYSTDIQRIELMAVLTAIRSAPKTEPITIFTDHKTICDVLAKSTRVDCEKGRNHNLWNQLRQLCSTRKITLNWVKAHAGNKANNAADRAARAAARSLLPKMAQC